MRRTGLVIDCMQLMNESVWKYGDEKNRKSSTHRNLIDLRKFQVMIKINFDNFVIEINQCYLWSFLGGSSEANCRGLTP